MSNVRRLGIIMNGVTGRMGRNQHLERSVLAIRDAGGVGLANGDRVVPDPVLVGRNPDKLKRIADEYGVERWTTDLDVALENPEDAVFFDAGLTVHRADVLRKAIAAGKHIYTEKPSAASLEEALSVGRLADDAGIKHGVVADKLFLPGIIKLRALRDAGFFGRILSARFEFGYWVFDGAERPAQRPSWNYRKADGGGIILDMFCHWRYVLDDLFGSVRSLTCLGARHIPKRYDEAGRAYEADADDAAYATFELENGVILHTNNSWTARVRRDDVATFQIDGTEGSAVAGLRRCFAQDRAATPRPVWNPDEPQPIDFYEDWEEVPDAGPYPNAFRHQWEAFIRHICEDAPFPWTLLEGAKGVQLAELGMTSWRDRRWVDVPPLEV